MITVDTNVLVRLLVRDDERQGKAAEQALRRAARVAVTLPCLCELLSVLGRVYGFSRADIAATLDAILDIPNIDVNRAAVIYGVATLRAGGDFADGVIAFEGRDMGGETFLSFDRKAVARVRAQGHQAEML